MGDEKPSAPPSSVISGDEWDLAEPGDILPARQLQDDSPKEGRPCSSRHGLCGAEKCVVAIFLLLVFIVVVYELFPMPSFSFIGPTPTPIPSTGCTFGAGFSCSDFAVDGASHLLQLQLLQATGSPLTVHAVSCGGSTFQALPNSVTIENGSVGTLSGLGSGNAAYCELAPGEAFNASACVAFEQGGSNRSACGVLSGIFSSVRAVTGSSCSPACNDGSACASGAECSSRFCNALHICVSCTQNCSAGLPCMEGAACASGSCVFGACTCSSACPDGSACRDASTCAGGTCTSGRCASPGKLALTSCRTITEPGNYTLSADISASGTCFQVHASGVTIECNGRTVTGKNKGTAFEVHGANVGILNCRVAWFERGVSADWQSSGLAVSNSSFANTTLAAVDLGSPNSSISKCTFEGNGAAVRAEATATGLSVVNSTFRANKADAISISFAGRGGAVEIAGNTIAGSTGAGIIAGSVTGGILRGNSLSGNLGGAIRLFGDCAANVISSNRIESNGGDSISVACSGTAISNNFIYGAAGHGLALTQANNRLENNTVCASGGSDILCSQGGAASGTGNVCMATSCTLQCAPCPFITSCTAISKPGRYWLTRNLSTLSTCITIASDGVSLDCGNNTISGGGRGAGISLSHVHDVEVSGCAVSGFYTGIELRDSSATIRSLFASESIGDGISLDASELSLSDSQLNANGRHGLAATSESAATVTNSSANANHADGFNLADGRHSFFGSSAQGNHGRGMYVGSASVTIANATLCGNYGPYQFSCEGASTLQDSGNNTCRPAYQCGVNCAACP